MKAALQKIAGIFDLRDVVFLLGIVFLGYGLYTIQPAYMYIVLGAIFVILTAWRV